MTVTDVLDFAATKPNWDTKQLFVVNQNELDIFGEIWVEAEVNVTWEIEIRNETNPLTPRVFRNEPADYALASNNLLSVELTLFSAGLSANVHPIKLRAWAKTTESLRKDDEQIFDFTVNSLAFANTSRVQLVGDPPVMGLQLWGDKQVRIDPYDGDNERMMLANPGVDVFTVELSNQETTGVIRCEVPSLPNFDPDFHYFAKCVIPDISRSVGAAGAWDLVVTLNAVEIFREPVDMWCPVNHYEKPNSDGLTSCHECDVGDTKGAICSVEWDDFPVLSGTTREGIVLEKAYWRASVDTDRVYPCSLDRACKGGDGGGQAEYCHEGYFGPFCATCESGWFM